MNESPQSIRLQTVDIKINIPELTGSNSFWLRAFPTRSNFADLYDECVNHPEVVPVRALLERVRASRHFWLGERMLRRTETVAIVLPADSGSSGQEISLALRRDFYHIGPESLLNGGKSRIFVNAEAPIGDVIPQILHREHHTRCFDLCDSRKRRLAPEKTLADYALWPAKEDTPDAPFPRHASLFLKARVSWFAYVLYAVAAVAGLLLGYGIIYTLLTRQPRGA